MNYYLLSLSVLSTAISLLGPKLHSQSPVIAPNAELTKVGSGYSFTEGPAADQHGNVYFTDQPNDRIYKWSADDNSVTLFMEGTKRSNGMYFNQQGDLISCADYRNQLIKIKPDKSMEVMLDGYQGKKLNGPNDLWIHPKGWIYFTDAYYKRDWWDHDSKELESENVYCYHPASGNLAVVTDQLVRPNGIIGTPDGQTLYISDIDDNKTYRYAIMKGGALGKRELLIQDRSDGMTIDNLGNIYLTNTNGVTVYDQNGEMIEQIPTGEDWTANVVFGGKDRQTLFITAMGSVYTLKMKVRGVE